MRLLAKKKGYSLSDHGLVEIEREKCEERPQKVDKKIFETERDIF